VAIVGETEQIADRPNSPLKSRARISDGSSRRFCAMRRKVCAEKSARYRQDADIYDWLTHRAFSKSPGGAPPCFGKRLHILSSYIRSTRISEAFERTID
jgi:hypothetical protein